ncbi:unnamed protein product [Closterium sp. NIES-54]
MRLLLALATTNASTLRGCTSTTTTAAATSTTFAAASTAAAAASTTPTAATEASTPATTPTSMATPSSSATPSASSTASIAALTVPSTTLAPLAPAGAAPPTRSRPSPDLLSANEPCWLLSSTVTASPATAATATTTAATATPTYCTAMASLRVLAFDHEDRPVQFDTWLDDLQLYLLRDSKDSVSLFNLVSGAATAPPATADNSTRSQWLTHDAAARLAICNHLPLAECAHFRQHMTAQALYDDVVARYSSPANAALGRLLLPYLFPELSAFATVEDLVSHLRTSNARYRAAVLAEFLDRNPPPMYITLYFIFTRLPDSLRSVRDHFLSLDPTSLTVDLLEQHLLAAETSAVAVDVSVPEDVGAASASAKRRSSKGKGGRGGSGGSGDGGGGSRSGGGGSSGGGGGSGSGGSGGGGTGGGGTDAWRVGSGGGQRQHQQRRSKTQSPQQLCEWYLRGASVGSCPYVIRTGDRAGQTCGRLHTQHRCFSCLDVAWRAEFVNDVDLPRSADLLKSRIAIFDLDFDAILSAMYALSISASESGTLLGTTPPEALHTFTLDSGASRCFFRDSTTLTPLPAPVPVQLADPSRGPVVARFSTVLPCPAVLSGSLSGLHLPSFSTKSVSTAALKDAMVTTTTPGGQRMLICTCTRTGRYLATFTRGPGSSLYTLATEPSQVAGSAKVSASGQVAASCSCRLLSHQTLLWHHRLGHPSLPRLSWHALSSSFEGGQRPAPHSSLIPPTIAHLQTLHMDVKGQVVDVLIPWIRTIRLQLRERFGQDLPVLRLHFYKGGEFSSNLLREFCRGESILKSFTLPDSPQQNGIAERRIGLVMEVARTSMIHAAASHFMWPFALRYVADQLILWPRDVTFDESVPFYRLFPYRSTPPPPPPLFLALGPPPVDPLLPQGPAPSGVSQVDPLLSPAPFQVAVCSGATPDAASGGAGPGGARCEGAETGGAEPGGVGTGGGKPGGAELGGAASEGAESGGAEPQGAASSGGSAGASPRLSPQHMREWFVRQARLRSGATGAGPAGVAGAGSAGVAAGAGGAGGAAATGPRGHTAATLEQGSSVEKCASFCAPICAPDTRPAWPCCLHSELEENEAPLPIRSAGR